MPAETAVTRPVNNPTVAVPVDAELHVPPGVASVSTVVNPIQPSVTPFIAPGTGLTVIVVVAVQPADSVYVMVLVPVVIPVAKPVPVIIVATAVLLLLHVPPDVGSVKGVVNPTHKL